MKRFKDLGIETTNTAFIGNKIDIDSILNQEIIVHKYKIEKSKYDRGNGMRLCLQIDFEEKKRIVFTNSVVLQERIQKVHPDDFPFTTTIIKEHKRYEFT